MLKYEFCLLVLLKSDQFLFNFWYIAALPFNLTYGMCAKFIFFSPMIFVSARFKWKRSLLPDWKCHSELNIGHFQ